MASDLTDPSFADGDEYQVEYDDDEEDDERTIEEEEQLSSDNEQNELDNLQADANMPLDELLKLYGQKSLLINNRSQEDDDDDEQTNSLSENNDENDHRHQFSHLLQFNGQLLSRDDDDETDDSFEPDIIKSINVGNEYQAQVEPLAEFDSKNECSDDREVSADELLWSSSCANDMDNVNIDEYLKIIRSEYPFADDEISLQILLTCQMSTELALTRFRQLPVKTIYSYPKWSLNEIQQFEEGLREYGKNFFKISVFKCLNRNVREIIHYYYQWKKSERYQLFIEEQQRLHAIISVTDMIEKLIEEQEQQQQQQRTAIDIIHSTDSSSMLSNGLKRNSSLSFVKIQQQDTSATKRNFDQIENDNEPPSKKSSLNTTNNSPATTVV